MGPQIPQRLTDQTAAHVAMIGSDPALRPGAKLPNEPPVSFSASAAPHCGEAVRSPGRPGLCGVRRGSGTFVLDRASAPDIEPAAVGKSPYPPAGSVRNPDDD